jgi:peptide-methionine (S)-S-oxide reductase
MMLEQATFAGGCFWCLEAVFERLRGVQRVQSGYAGGHVAAPTYAAVCTGRTGHAEAVQVSFDPAVIGYEELVEIFFAFHDPTTLDRQGPDTGSQYRSAIFTHSDAQARTVAEVMARLAEAAASATPVVTEVRPLDRFWPAEISHQEYYRRNPAAPYCQAWIAPKVAKLRAHYAERLKPAPVG